MTWFTVDGFQCTKYFQGYFPLSAIIVCAWLNLAIIYSSIEMLCTYVESLLPFTTEKWQTRSCKHIKYVSSWIKPLLGCSYQPKSSTNHEIELNKYQFCQMVEDEIHYREAGDMLV